MEWMLIVVAIFSAPGKSGVSTTHIPFADQMACQQAAKVMKTDVEESNSLGYRTYCVPARTAAAKGNN